jgi:CRISPR/Cas system CSM-associated protein Csm3 (group 7 of RAMP superfamily)
VLPGSQVKGRLRHAAEQVARGLGLSVCRSPYAAAMCPNAPEVEAPPCVICALFGAPAWPSPLRWRDLRALPEEEGGRATSPPGSLVRGGVALDRRLGTAAPGSAYFVETTPALSGETLRFQADPAIAGQVADAALPQLLLAACRLVASFGAGGSRGLGWSTVEATARLDGEPLAPDPAGLSRLGAAVTSRGS